MIKTYSTFAGARRAARRTIRPDLPILRLLDDPRELWIVLPSADTRIMAVDGHTASCDGSISYLDLSTGGKAS